MLSVSVPGNGIRLKAGWLFLLLMTFLPSFSEAAEFRFRHLTSAQELPYQQVEALLQDSRGYIWIGSRRGLSRYDGYCLKNYFHSDSNPNSLKGNFVKNLFLDHQGRMWVCTESGLCRYRPLTDDFKNYDQPQGPCVAITENHNGKIICGTNQLYVYDESADRFRVWPSMDLGVVSSLCCDKDDNLYVGASGRIFRFSPSLTHITPFTSSYFSDFTTVADGIIPMMVDSRGLLWVGRNGKGVMWLNPRTGSMKVYPPRMLTNGIVRAITEDKEGSVWLGTEKGITIIKTDGSLEALQCRFNEPNGLSDNAVYAILSDRMNNMWVGTYFGGVDILLRPRHLFSCFLPGYKDNNVKGKVVRMMVETTPGIFWIASEDGCVNIFNRATGQISLFTAISGLGTNVHSLCYDRPLGNMWIGTFRNGLFLYNLKSRRSKHYLEGQSIFYILRQPNGLLWIAPPAGLLYYDEPSGVFRAFNKAPLNNCFVYTLCAGPAGSLWVGTTDFGLFKIDARHRLFHFAKGKSGLRDNYVTSLCYSRNGTLWIGTNNYGLQYLSSQGGKISSMSVGLPLGSNMVCGLIEDRYGCLWVMCSDGLYRLSRNRSVAHFTTDDGLSTNQFNFSSALQTSDGSLLLGTVNGLVIVDPDRIKSRETPMHVHLEGLFINNVEVNANTQNAPYQGVFDDAKRIVLTFGQARSFSIEYAVLLPGVTGSEEYQLFFEGVDRTWRDVGNERKFYGYNLSPGTYKLHIRANNGSRQWEQCPVKTIEVVVKPPFYRSSWAYMLYLLVFLFFCWIVYKVFHTRMEARNAVHMANLEKEKIEEVDREKLSFFTTVSHELKTPLSLIEAPLLSLQRMSLEPAARKHLSMALKNANSMERLISELVTFNKVETDNFPFYVQKGNPLDFISRLCTSFAEAAARYGLHFSVNCEDNGEDVWFSPSYLERILGNLLSNAFKFTPEGGSIVVTASITSKETSDYSYLSLTVADTGIGIDKKEVDRIFDRFYQTRRGYSANSSGWGIGLSLVKRLAEIHEGSVGVESEPGKGSTFTVLLNVSPGVFPPKCYVSSDKILMSLDRDKHGLVSDEAIPAASLPTGPTPAHIAEDKPVLLLVEDNKDMLSFLSDFFAKDHKVFTASNGSQALELAHKHPIQLVISDVMMPGIDGMELCRRLKGDVVTSHIPVILLTARNEASDVVTGYKSGAEAFVSKPFDPAVLALQAKNILQLMRNRQSEMVETPEADLDATMLSELDKDFMRKINDIVDRNLSRPEFSILDVTREAGISRSLLHTKMKSLVNMPMGDYIRMKRLMRASKLLKEGYNVSETAYKVGFSDPGYFSKAFKKYYGVSPSEYVDTK